MEVMYGSPYRFFLLRSQNPISEIYFPQIQFLNTDSNFVLKFECFYTYTTTHTSFMYF